MLENYYLSGLPIDLTNFNLGHIYQLTYKEFIEKKIDIDNFIIPFLTRKETVRGSSVELDEFIDGISNFEFLTYVNEGSGSDELKNSLMVLYRTENVYVNPITRYYHIDDVEINTSNFDILSNVVLEMFKMELPKFEEKKELSEIDKRFEMLRKQHKKKSKKKGLELKDIVNIIIHSNECGLDYDKVFNMTIYQIKNTFETLMCKHNCETMLEYKLSSKFDIKEKVEDWHNKIIVKSSAIH